MGGTLADALAATDNNYLPVTAAICGRIGLGWHEPTPPAAAAGTGLSVVIPVRENAYSLATVLDALAAQDTTGVVEVIVVDDASTDDTPAIAAAHPAVDRALRLPRQVGAAAARNVGTCLAETDTVVYLDADMVLPPHVLADVAARAHPELVLVGFRHNITYRAAGNQRAAVPDGEPDLAADHRVRWRAPAGVAMFYSGQIYPRPFVCSPLDDTREFLDLGCGATYHDWDLPRMVVTALVAAPRRAVLDVGGFDAGFDECGWGSEDTHLGAALIAAGCKVAPLRQARGFHIDPPDADAQWTVKFATAASRIDHYRRLLDGPVPSGQAAFTTKARALVNDAEELR
ncbi:MAG: glycosyltransferase family 2 protein [Micromonosporaceae bacterium]